MKQSRPIMRKMCDLINRMPIDYSFTMGQFSQLYKDDNRGFAAAEGTVRVFLSRVVHQGYVLSEQIPGKKRSGAHVTYTKILHIPEVKMTQLTRHPKEKLPDLRKKRSETPMTEKQESGEQVNSIDVFKTLEAQHKKILELKEELRKANEDCKTCAEREAAAREQASKYQHELNELKKAIGNEDINIIKQELTFLKKKIGVVNVQNLSKYLSVLEQ